MTTITDDGLEFVGDRLIGNSSAVINTVAVGTGQNESSDATALGNQEYSATDSSNNVEILETGTTGEIEFVITLKGGTEVPANTDVTEIGLFTDDGTLVVIDEFSGVTVEDGRTEEFVVPLDPQR